VWQHFSKEKLLQNEIDDTENQPDFLERGQWMQSVEMKHFHKLTAPLLRAFVHCHTFKSLKVPGGSALPNKGRLEEAEQGGNTLVKLAFDRRHHQITLTTVTTPTAVSRVIVPVMLTMQEPHEEVRWKPSELMRNDRWTSMLQSTFKLGDAVQIRVNRTDNDAVRSDHLYQLLQHRLTKHIRKRVSDQTKHNHWCLHFAQHNLPQVCALAVMVGHIKKNIDTARDDTCLLSPHVSNFHKVAPDEGGRAVPGEGSWEQLEGCYLIHEEAEELRWIRSARFLGCTVPRLTILLLQGHDFTRFEEPFFVVQICTRKSFFQ